jgi:preprotein translocase subunit SecD
MAIVAMATDASATTVELRMEVTCERGMHVFALSDLNPNEKIEHLCLSPDVVMDQTNILRAVRVTERGQASVALTYDDAGRARMSEITKQYVGHRLAILVDGAVVSAPVIINPILGNTVNITGPSDDMDRILQYFADGPTHA